MKTSQSGRHLIESFEGLILQSYDDYNDHIINTGDTVHGVLTIGYGHTSAAGAPIVSIGQTITREQADEILGSDLEKVEREVERLVRVKLTQNQFDALVSFEFNTGALHKSSILVVLNQGDYNTAADRLLLYDKAQGHVLAGLQRRRQAERTLFLKSPTPVQAPAGTTGEAPRVTGWNVIVDAVINFLAKLFSKGK